MRPMRRYIATFAPGFESIVGTLLAEALEGAVPAAVSSGMLTFDYAGPPERAAGVIFFNNVFLVVQQWNSSAIPFDDLVRRAVKSDLLGPLAHEARRPGARTFRVRYSRENQFAQVDRKTMDAAESYVSRRTGLVPDRFDPDMEFWFMARREGQSFFAALETKKASTESYLAPGELRPEIVQLIVGLARARESDRVILDPFAGHGAIPARLAAVCPDSRILASDIDPALAEGLRERFAGNPRLEVTCADALDLRGVADSSVDLIVTDPPWGCWDAESYRGDNSLDTLYRGMLREFGRVLKPGARAFVLTGAKREFEAAVSASGLFGQHAADAPAGTAADAPAGAARAYLRRPASAAAGAAPGEGTGHAGPHPAGAVAPFRTDILVNGKKSAVYALFRPGR